MKINATRMFQFPSNGKAHGKEDSDYEPGVNGPEVSIPFKREGTWKDYRKSQRLYTLF